MAHEYSSFAIKRVNFEFDKRMPEIYDEAYKKAYEIEKDELIEDMELEGIEDYDADQIMKSDEHQRNVKYMANKMIFDAAEIPYTIVVTFKGDLKLEQVSDEMIAKQIREKYGLEVVSFEKDYPHAEDILRQKTADSVGKVFESGDYKTFLKIKENLKNYSFNNTCMVYCQYPDAQAVKGFKAWKEFDREVVKGSKAIEIWCPSFIKLSTEEQVDKYIDRIMPLRKITFRDMNGNITEIRNANESARANKKKEIMDCIETKGSYERLTGYRTGRVFDIMQTQYIDPQTGKPDPDNDNLEEILNRDKKLRSELADAKNVVDAVNDTLLARNLLFKCKSENSEDVYNAVYRYAKDILSNDPSSVMGIKSTEISKGALAETEVLVATGLICEHIGIEDGLDKAGLKMTEQLQPNEALKSASSFKRYLEEGAEGRKIIFKKAFDRGSALAAEFNKEYDKNLSEILKLNSKEKNVEKESIER